MAGFHARDGWYFERLEDGSVQVTSPPPEGKSTILDRSTWASAVASVTPEGETHGNFYLIEALHRGEFRFRP